MFIHIKFRNALFYLGYEYQVLEIQSLNLRSDLSLYASFYSELKQSNMGQTDIHDDHDFYLHTEQLKTMKNDICQVFIFRGNHKIFKKGTDIALLSSSS